MKVILHKLFPYAPYLNEYIGFEESIPDNWTDEQALAMADRLRKLAERSHKEQYPHLYTESGLPVIVKQVPDDRIKELDAEIEKLLIEAKEKMLAAKTKKEAEKIFQDAGFPFNLELKQILNDKK
jgi:hypothetical protein